MTERLGSGGRRALAQSDSAAGKSQSDSSGIAMLRVVGLSFQAPGETSPMKGNRMMNPPMMSRIPVVEIDRSTTPVPALRPHFAIML